MAKKNPFSKTTPTRVDPAAEARQANADSSQLSHVRQRPQQPSDEPEIVAPVNKAAGTIASLRDDELQQPISESDAGPVTPDAVNDNAAAGTESGLVGEVALGERVGRGAAAPDDGSGQDEASIPQFKGERFGVAAGNGAEGGGGGSGGLGSSGAESDAGGGGPAPGNRVGVLDGGSVQEGLAAASGDHAPDVDLTRTPRESIAAGLTARSGGESLSDLQGLSAAAAIAGASAVETEPSVADAEQSSEENNAARKAIEDRAARQVELGLAEAGLEGDPHQSHGQTREQVDRMAGNAQSVESGGGIHARVIFGDAAAQEAADEAAAAAKKAADEAAARAQKAADEAAARAQEAADEAVAAQKAADEAAAAAKKAAGGGVKTSTDPDDPSGGRPATPEQFALDQAIRAELGLVRTSGDIDPLDGDGTSGTAGSGPGTAGSGPGNLLTQQGQGLITNPGSPEAKPAPSGDRFGGSPPIVDGTVIRPEEGDNFDKARTKDMEEINVGAAPLVPFPKKDEEDEQKKADESDTLFALSQQDRKAADDD